MYFVPKKNKRFNVFKRVKVLRVKDIYNRIGERMPKASTTGAVAIFNTSKIDQLNIGEIYANIELEQSTQSNEVVVETATQSDNSDEGASATSE